MKLNFCDKCGNKESEYHNLITIKHTFGYGTVYDGKSIELDICEECFIGLFKDQL